MRYLKNLILFFLILSFYSCGTVKEGFTNQKKENKDEFLVEKKSPLVMPPDYDELPLPNSEISQEESSENGVKKLITNNDNLDGTNSDYTKNNKNFENSILEKIRKN